LDLHGVWFIIVRLLTENSSLLWFDKYYSGCISIVDTRIAIEFWIPLEKGIVLCITNEDLLNKRTIILIHNYYIIECDMMILIICKRRDDIEETIPCSGNDGQSNTGILSGTRFPVRKTPFLNLWIIPATSHLLFPRKSGSSSKINFNYLIYSIYILHRYMCFNFIIIHEC